MTSIISLIKLFYYINNKSRLFGLQDANSPIVEKLILHDFINIILIFIITFVGFIMIRILFNLFINKNLLKR